MDQRTLKILFALLRSAIGGTKLTDQEKSAYLPEMLPNLLKISSAHDLVHLLAFSLKQNELISKDNANAEKSIFKAVYRYEKLKYEFDSLCHLLEEKEIPFIPLKGSVIRKFYPEPWMRTSCDIDILVHREDLKKAVSYLAKELNYTENEHGTHDISLFSPSGVHIEIHYDLVEEEYANNANNILTSVWNSASLIDNKNYWYEMSDEFFYFYHIAHMAKHFENGGCGIRPFVDLWLLDNLKDESREKRDELLLQGELLKFANSLRSLNRVWFGSEEYDDLTVQMQDFLFHGGMYGTADNRVALRQQKAGGKFGYVVSRIFIPSSKLKRYYPVLEKHTWLLPFMQVRRWFMLLRPDVAKLAKRELAANTKTDKGKTGEVNDLFKNIGL